MLSLERPDGRPRGERSGSGNKKAAKRCRDITSETRIDSTGRPITYAPLNTCAGCNGARNKECQISGEEVILCDGEGCTKEYHLGCCIPPLTSVPETEFFCFDCSIEGSSKYLLDYFLSVKEEKERSGGSYFMVAGKLMGKEKGSNEETGGKEGGSSGSWVVESEIDKFDEYRQLIKASTATPQTTSTSTSTSTSSSASASYNRNGNGNSKGSSDSSSVSAWASSVLPKIWGGKPTAKEKAPMPNITDISEVVDSKEMSGKTSSVYGGALLGCCVRLYCPVDKRYHVGRILDWRVAQRPLGEVIVSNEAKHPSGSDDNDGDGTNNGTGNNSWTKFYGNGPTSGCEFLVRFRAGAQGRKVPVHRWIVLEEHEVSVGCAVVWGKTKTLPWWPGMILLRSALEVKQGGGKGMSDREGQTVFFGRSDVEFIPLKTLVAPFLAESFEENRLRSSEKNITVSCSMAEIELEEQRRVKNWVGNGENEPICFDRNSTLDFGEKVYKARSEPPPKEKKKVEKPKEEETTGKKRKGSSKPDEEEDEEFHDTKKARLEKEKNEAAEEKSKNDAIAKEGTPMEQFLKSTAGATFSNINRMNPKISRLLKNGGKATN